MDNQMLLSNSSDHPTTEAAGTVPYMVQPASSDTINLIGIILIAIMLILTALTITLICIELRQDTLRKLIHSMAERLERIEDRLKEITSNDSSRTSASTTARKAAEKNSAANPAKSASSDPVRGLTSDNKGAGGAKEKSHNRTDGDHSTGFDGYPDPSNFHEIDETAIFEKKQRSPEPLPLVPAEEPSPICGLKVNASSYYNQNGPVNFDVLPVQESVFILYSDMTLIPNGRQFNIFNTASYYTYHDFTMVFDFQTEEGYPVNMNRPLKCLKVASAATVTNSPSGYFLEKRGILIAEER